MDALKKQDAYSRAARQCFGRRLKIGCITVDTVYTEQPNIARFDWQRYNQDLALRSLPIDTYRLHLDHKQSSADECRRTRTCADVAVSMNAVVAAFFIQHLCPPEPPALFGGFEPVKVAHQLLPEFIWYAVQDGLLSHQLFKVPQLRLTSPSPLQAWFPFLLHTSRTSV